MIRGNFDSASNAVRLDLVLWLWGTSRLFMSAEAYEVRWRNLGVENPPNSESLRGKLMAVLKRSHTRACEWKAEAKMIILTAWKALRSRNRVALVGVFFTMSDDRFGRRVDASSAAGAVEPFMIPLVQGLGRFDCHLIHEECPFRRSQSGTIIVAARGYPSHRPIHIVLFLGSCCV